MSEKTVEYSFCENLRNWISRRHPLLSHFLNIFVVSVGLLIVLIGIVLIPLPGPGWLIVFIGLSFIGVVSERVDKFLMKVKKWLKNKFDNVVKSQTK